MWTGLIPIWGRLLQEPTNGPIGSLARPDAGNSIGLKGFIHARDITEEILSHGIDTMPINAYGFYKTPAAQHSKSVEVRFLQRLDFGTCLPLILDFDSDPDFDLDYPCWSFV